MTQKLIIYGNGQIAKMMYQFLKTDYDVCAFTVDDQCIQSSKFEGLPLIAFEEINLKITPDNAKMLIAVGFSEMNTIREYRHATAKSMGYRFINYIHPSVYTHDTQLGENNIILDYVSIHPGCVLGNSNFIGSNTNLGHGVRISNNCWINSGVGIGGETTVKDNCFIGINATVAHGLHLNEKTFLGANSLLDCDSDRAGVYISSKAEKHRLSSDNFLNFSAGL